MSFRERFKRKLGLRSSKDHDSCQSQDYVQQDIQQPHLRAAGSSSERNSTNTLTDSPSPSTPLTQCLSDQPPQGHVNEGAIQEAALTRKDNDEHDIRALWDLAYEALREEDERLIQDFEEKIEGDLSAGLSKAVGSRVAKREWMDAVLARKMEQVNQDSWKLKFRSSEVLVKDVVKPVLGVVSWANEFITKAVSSNPSASLAWGGVSLLLPLLLNPSKQAASLAQGIEYISSLIVQSYLWEDLYERRFKSEPGGSSQTSNHTYRSALKTLYRHVLKFQITSYCYYAHSTAYRLGLDSVKWNEWEELLEKIKDQERVLSAVLTICRDVRYDEECFAAEQRHRQVMSCWESIGTDVSGLLSAVREAQREDKRKELLQWLCAVDTSALYNAARDKHQIGTCRWLVEDSKDFKTWMESPKSLLWLNGKPGSGKSILSSSVIKHVQDNCKSDPGTALAYFYFNFGSQEQQSVAIMLSSFVKQLCASRPDTPQAIKNFEGYKTKGERPDTKTLEDALIASSRGFSGVFIVIDALDECSIQNGERGKLLASLTRIVAAMPDSLHLFCTSRPEPDISTAITRLLSSTSGNEINLMEDTTGLDGDMSTYIDSVLESDDYRSWPAELKDDAKRLLIEKADGMFQYIVCQFEGLRNLRSKSLISSALKNLPKGLDATYDRLLLSLEPEFEAQILNTLKWLAFANRTLRLEELAEIFIFHPERAVLFDKEERLFEPEEVLRYIPSLVTVQKVHDKDTSDAVDDKSRRFTTYVRLAHFTVKEYMISSRIGKGPAARYSFTENDAHLHISHCCLAYHLYKVDETYTDDSFPVGDYATGNIGWHLEMTPRHKWTSEIVRLAARALAVHSSSLIEILCITINRDDFDAGKPGLEQSLRRPYCYTASRGFLHLTDLLLSPASDTYDYLTQEDLDLTLLKAASAGSSGIVRLLLDKGAHVNAQNDKGESALQLAASRNHSETVNLLLSRGADTCKSVCALTSTLSSLDSMYWKTISEQSSNWTTSADCNNSLQLLIDHGADINKQCAVHGTALSMAASKLWDHRTRYFVDFLLQRGADVNLLGGYFGYPLQAACSSLIGVCEDNDYEFQSEVVMALLEMGAEVNAQGGRYGNALQAASCASNIRTVYHLLRRGAVINMPGGHYGTALQAACANKHWFTAEELLDGGAEVNVQGGVYGNALQAACYSNEVHEEYSRMEIVQHLLERGADVNAGGGKFASALQAACASKNNSGEAIARLLLSKGAKINAQGGKYGTAIQGACARGNTDVVFLLLGHGCDLNIEGGKYGTALQAACAPKAFYARVFYYKLVRLLIQRGADVHVQGGKFGSAWHAAAAQISGKSTKVNGTLKMLLNHGVDVNDSRGRLHGTALQAAIELCRNPEKAIARVRFLLERGADINAGAGLYGFPLQSACVASYSDGRSANWKVLSYLFENCPDIDVNMTGGKFGTALQAAAYTGNMYAVYLLVGDVENADAEYQFFAGGSGSGGHDDSDSDGYDDSVSDVHDDSVSGAHDDAPRAPRRVANINAHGGEYGSALVAAAHVSETFVAESLLNYGAEADARGGKYGTALNTAVVKGNWDLVETLLKAGAKPGCRDLPEHDEEWLKWVEKEDGRGAVEGYRKFWEKQKLKSAPTST
ncbi:hypothetical protein CORC01_02893 [Colletotrichum orchidophilum]|uniref:Uncharacterized protein n=1 Tax=Colletotrichum orchidophilum TaxID=1209926 RepID=A0A1G4BJT0_9PEZI|nr:uncharacterized protein CORC01_02893 [Colletotrichum orchidophilum]OHF01702.1 hypothetical protein CORC01_02893 [Colletotrichum orchidophilum]